MKLSEAKILYKLGSLSNPIILRSPDEPGWVLEFTVDKRVALGSNRLHAQRGQVRVFRSIDAAASAAEQIGFSRVEVALDPPQPLS